MAAGVAVRALLASLALCAIAPGVAMAAVTFTATPANPSNQTTATFSFHDSAGGNPSFTCALDSAAPTSCAGGSALPEPERSAMTFTVPEATVAIAVIAAIAGLWILNRLVKLLLAGRHTASSDS